MADRTKALVVVLVLIIVVLAGIVAFTFLVKPKVTGYTVEKQNEGANFAVLQLAGLISYPNCQSFPYTIGNETVTFVSWECVQARQQQAQVQQPLAQ